MGKETSAKPEPDSKPERYVVYHEAAHGYLATLSEKLQNQIINKIAALKSDPFPSGSKPLKGQKGTYRIRSGDYRVLYTVRNPVITVTDIDHRKDVYKKR